MRGCTTSGRYVRILDFRHFESFFRFDKNGSNRRKKTLSNGDWEHTVVTFTIKEKTNIYFVVIKTKDYSFSAMKMSNPYFFERSI